MHKMFTEPAFVEYFSLAVLAIMAVLISFEKGKFLADRFRFWLLPVSALAVFSALFYQVRLLFLAWSANELTRPFVPPFNKEGIGYFMLFSWTHYFSTYVISLIGAVLFILLARWLNKKYGDKFFYREEIQFAALGVFFTGYPGMIYYLAAFFSLYLLFEIIVGFAGSFGDRVSPYFFWIPIALSIILLVNHYAQFLPFFRELSF